MDLWSIMKAAPELPGERYRIYPADDDRVLRSIRKIVRGLCHYHGIGTAIPDSQVVADVLRKPIPDPLFERMSVFADGGAVFDYGVVQPEEASPWSLWLLRFYERTAFVAVVTKEPEAA